VVGGYLLAVVTGRIVSSLGDRASSAQQAKAQLKQLLDREASTAVVVSDYVLDRAAGIAELEPELEERAHRLAHAASVEIAGDAHGYARTEELNALWEEVLSRHPEDPRFTKHLEEEELKERVYAMAAERRAAQKAKRTRRR
jgi:hypothetical protein